MEETLQALLRQRSGSSNSVPQHRYSASSALDEDTELPTAADEPIGHDHVATIEETWPPLEDVDEDEVDGLATITDTERSSSSFYGKLF